MRRSAPRAALLCASVLATAACGLAVAGTPDAATPGTGALAGLRQSAWVVRTGNDVPRTGVTGTGATGTGVAGSAAGTPTAAPMVTVPALTTAAEPAASTRPPTSPAPTGAPETSAPDSGAPGAGPPQAGAPEPDPAVDQPPPADVPVVAPYGTVLGWLGQDRVVYLTFDDGPGPATGRVLDILAASGVTATFCMVGQQVTRYPDLARRVAAEGHTLCNHSWDHHSPFDELPAQALDQQIGSTQEAITTATGVTPRWFRAPEGRFGPAGGTVLQAGQRARTIPLGWGVDSRDWQRPGTDTIVSGIVGAASPGAVVLLHDGGGPDRDQTLQALPAVIAGLLAAGYTPAPLPPDPAG